jgi:hypothetical protein
MMPFLADFGMKPSRAALMRMLMVGACAARQNALSTSPTRIAFAKSTVLRVPSTLVLEPDLYFC